MKGLLACLLGVSWMQLGEAVDYVTVVLKIPVTSFIPESSRGFIGVPGGYGGAGGAGAGGYGGAVGAGAGGYGGPIATGPGGYGGVAVAGGYGGGADGYGSGNIPSKDDGSNGGGADGMDPLSEEPNYTFRYEVQDPESGNDFGHMEARMGNTVTGSYHVLLPDGRVQRVDYVADQNGYRPVISYEGEAKYGPGVGVGKPMVDSIGGYRY